MANAIRRMLNKSLFDANGANLSLLRRTTLLPLAKGGLSLTLECFPARQVTFTVEENRMMSGWRRTSEEFVGA